MQGDQQSFSQNRDQTGNGYPPDPYMSSFFGQNVDFQPSQNCPKNYIIFDRTDNRSQIMYNPGLYMGAPYFPEMKKDVNSHSVMKEDSADIDALLSFEDEYEEDDEEEEVSTARTDGNDSSDTYDSCSSRNVRFGSSSSNGSRGGDVKRKKLKKMVRSLRGIVPGGNPQMNTVDVLDEAVKYLKSLKVEARKMGRGNGSG